MIINAFWSGKKLTDLNLKVIESWREQYPNNKFILWTYSKIENVPKGLTVVYGDKILSRKKWFSYDKGYGRKSPVAFSNLFRSELLYKNGGLYVDLDVLCTKQFEFWNLPHNVFLANEEHPDWHSIGTAVIYARYPGETIFNMWSKRIKDKVDSGETLKHGDLGPRMLTKCYEDLGRPFMLYDKDFFYPICYTEREETRDVIKDKLKLINTYGVHLFQSIWKQDDYKLVSDI